MKEFFLSECARFENKNIVSSFVVISKQVKAKKTGEPYLALTLGDRCGQIEAKMWDNVEHSLDAFDQEDFVKIKALLNKYKNRFQLTIHKLRKLGESEIDFGDYLPKTSKDIDALWLTLAEFVGAPIMVVFLVLLFRMFLRRDLLEQAKHQMRAERRAQRHP